MGVLWRKEMLFMRGKDIFCVDSVVQFLQRGPEFSREKKEEVSESGC